jgi:hypothetical protein
MPSSAEVEAVIDVLWNMKWLREEYESRWVPPETLLSNLASHVTGKYPPRPSMASMKQEFEKGLYEAVLEGLQQAQKVRDRFQQLHGRSWDQIEDEVGVFEDDEWYSLRESLDQIAAEIYPVNATIVRLKGAERNFGVELYIKRFGPHLIEGFDSYESADQWIRGNADAYAVSKGAPAGTKVVKLE